MRPDDGSLRHKETYPVTANVGSIGGGVQSFTMFAKACLGELPGLDAGIFADTGWERQKTYDAIEFLRKMGDEHGIPLYTVQYGNIRDDMLENKTDGKAPGMPLFILNPKGEPAQLRRQCTADYKIRPIRKLIDELFHPKKKTPVAQWIGISLDEATRMRDSNVQKLYHRYPLVEERMTRGDCYLWLERNGFPTPVKSSCIGCPYHHDSTWASLEEDELQDAIDFDNTIRNQPLASSMGTSKREHKNRPEPNQTVLFDVDEPTEYKEQVGLLDDRQYIHRSIEPLSARPFLKKAVSKDQLDIDLEMEECTGGCFL